MTQDLRANAAPPNLPREFDLMCTTCGRHSSKVRWSKKTKTNICQPDCRGKA